MKLLKPLFYFSPSSYMEWKKCPWKFYLKRLSGHTYESFQSAPAACGSAFDAFVKNLLCKKLKLDLNEYPILKIKNLMKSVEYPEGNDYEQIINVAKNLSELYVKLGFADDLLEEGLTDLELDLFEIIDGVPIRGMPDAACGIIPHDFKVRGYRAKSPFSPTPGYKVYVTSTGQKKAPHDRCTEYLENLNEQWAIQMAIYSWLLKQGNNIPFIPFADQEVSIDEVCFSTNYMIFTKIRTKVSKEFQEKLHQDLILAYYQTKLGEIPEAQPCQAICYEYNHLCEVAYVCKKYVAQHVDKEFDICQR